MDVLRPARAVLLVVIYAAAANVTYAVTIVTGTVFCDQCKDGHLSLYDYPLSGVKVAVACPGQDGELRVVMEETSNWLGGYSIKFDSAPDLSSCFVQVSGSNGDAQNCTAAAGPAQKPRAFFRMFYYAFYSVDSLLSQPLQPMPFCLRRSSPAPQPPPSPALPPADFEDLPPSPGLPPVPYNEASDCEYRPCD